MELNKNEKAVLKLLLKDAKISDSAIASQIKISSQAVGKIRKKLEKAIIKSYTLNVDFAKLGLQTFVISLAKLTSEGMDEGEIEIERKLLEDPYIIGVYRLPSGSSTHIIRYGFRDISEMENYFHFLFKKAELHKFIENQQLFTFSHNSLIKDDSIPLIFKIIDKDESELLRQPGFLQIDNFKKRLYK